MDGITTPVTLSFSIQNRLEEAKWLYQQKLYEQSYPLLKKLDKEHNNSSAQFTLGKMYFYGQFVGEDHQTALKFFTKASDNGNLYALRGIGHIYCSGRGNVPPDYQKAMFCFEQTLSSKKEKEQCWNDIGLLHYNGFGVPKDYSLALHYFERDPSSLSLNNIGKMYIFGLGVNQDFQKSFSYLQKASENHSHIAFINLGVLYLFGLGVPQDVKEAMRLYKEALHKHPDHRVSAIAFRNLAMFYYYGLGVSKNDQIVIEYFKQANELDNSETIESVEEFQQRRKTALKEHLENKEYAAALIHLLFLELDKDPEVQFQIGMLYSGVEGIKQSDTNTVTYLTLAHEGGHPEAAFRLGESYMSRYMSRSIFRKDPVEARIWYRKTPCNLSGEISFKVATVLIDNNNKKDGKTILAHLRNAIEKEHPQAQQLHDTWTASQKPFEWNSLFSFGNEAPESNPKVIN